MRRALLMAVILASGCGSGDASTAPAESTLVRHDGVVHGSGWTEDDSDPRLPRVALEGRAAVAPDDAIFHLALRSDVVVEAHAFAVGESELERRRRVTRWGGGEAERGPWSLEDGTYRSLKGHVDQVLLGEYASPTLRFDVWCATVESGDLGVPCAAMREVVASPSRNVVVFLVRSRGSKFWFAGYTADAMQPPLSDEALETIRRTWAGTREWLSRAPRPPIQARVDEEVARMTTTPAEQYDALRTLINLGPSAIPALVRHFNDRSTLPSSAIMVENAPEHWEAYAHYGIATVTDGLALVASILSNGPSCDELLHAGEDHTADAERDRCEQRWVAYVARGLSEGAFGQEWQ